MAYSRKRYWLAVGAALAVVAAFLALAPQLRSVPIGLWVIQMAVVAVCGALALLAYFSLDEIQRQNEMRAWYYGGLTAILFGFAPLMLLMSNSLLETMAGFLPNASQMATDMQHSPKVYVGLGVAMTLVLQAIGHFIAHAIFKVIGRAR